MSKDDGQNGGISYDPHILKGQRFHQVGLSHRQIFYYSGKRSTILNTETLGHFQFVGLISKLANKII